MKSASGTAQHSKQFLLLSFISFFQAHAIEEAFRKDRWCSAEKGAGSTKKGEGEQRHKEKLSPLPFELIINAAQWEKRKYRAAYLRITDKSERGRRSLVVASQAVGVLAVCRPHRRPIPSVSGPSFLFPMSDAFGLLFGSVSSVCTCSPPRADHYELDASSEPRREKHDKENNLCNHFQDYL